MAVTLKKSPEGTVVIVRGFGWVTASGLLPHAEALRLAAAIEVPRAKRKAGTK
jgi:hypothetical protein